MEARNAAMKGKVGFPACKKKSVLLTLSLQKRSSITSFHINGRMVGFHPKTQNLMTP